MGQSECLVGHRSVPTSRERTKWTPATTKTTPIANPSSNSGGTGTVDSEWAWPPCNRTLTESISTPSKHLFRQGASRADQPSHSSLKQIEVTPLKPRYDPRGACCEGRSLQTASGTVPGFAWQGPCAATSAVAPRSTNRARMATRRTMRPCCVANRRVCSFIECHHLAHPLGQRSHFWSISRNQVASCFSALGHPLRDQYRILNDKHTRPNGWFTPVALKRIFSNRSMQAVFTEDGPTLAKRIEKYRGR